MNQQSKFDKTVDRILENEEEWNRGVKNKHYKILEKDSYREKVVKIYRHFNEDSDIHD
tara:strand:+ start:488 stop:661 length:174 start_codon:yes stop_codon:yes gene_type:complete